MRRLLGVALLGTAASVTGCDEVGMLEALAFPPSVETAYARLLPGAVMPLVVSNDSPKEWEYGGCPYSLQRLEEGEWRRASQLGYGICDMYAVTLPPGATRHFMVPLPEVVGTYRVLFRVQHSPHHLNEVITLVSNTFRVGYVSADAAP